MPRTTAAWGWLGSGASAQVAIVDGNTGLTEKSQLG
jgi:hypothetical protein